MLNLRKQTLKYAAVSLLLAIFLFPLNSHAEVCFDDITSGKMVVALEQAKITEQQLSTKLEGNTELQNQIDILRNTIKLYEEQIIVYNNMTEMNKRMGELKDKACADQVKAATPTFMDNMKKYLVGMGIGGLLVGIAIVVL